MPPEIETTVQNFEGLLCDGEICENVYLSDALGENGGLLYFQDYAFSAISRHWWRRFADAGWNEVGGVTVIGVGLDGPYAQNAFLRDLGSPFRIFSDVEGYISSLFELLYERDGMAHTVIPQRAVFVLDSERTVRFRWIAADSLSPPPLDQIYSAITDL